MLHKETVQPTTLALIKKLQQDNNLHGFYLVGGTALALQIGHRISDDIDLFTSHPFDSNRLAEYMETNYQMSVHYLHSNTLKGFINNVLIDFITHNYDLVEAEIEVEGIKMLSKKDIAAMKVNAISGNGTRMKDFIDLYFLLKEFTLQQIIEFYKKKYKQRNDFHALKSLTYFEDIDTASWPRMILERNLTLEKIKTSITDHQSSYLK